MREIDRYYQVLGLNSGALEEEIKQAYRDLANVWHPDRFPNNQRLREKANEKLKEINNAYEKLKSYLAENSRGYASESEQSPDNPRPKWRRKKSSSTESWSYDQYESPSNDPPPGYSYPFAQKARAHISWKLLALFFVILGSRVGANFNNELIGAISGFLIGMGTGIFLNHLEKTRKYKIRIAWAVGAAGVLLYGVLFDLTAPEHRSFVSSLPSPSHNERLTSNPPASPLSPDPAMDREESEEIASLFEKIRQANFQEDINLFMSCFSHEFNGAERKRKDTLKIWETFYYQDLSYELKKQTISGDTADVRLEWLVMASERLGGKPYIGTSVLDVALKREDGGWKIKEIKPAS